MRFTLDGSGVYVLVMVYERNLKRLVCVNRKYYQKFSQKTAKKQDEKRERQDRFIQAIEFFRFLFDDKRSHPFSQFIDKKELEQIRSRAKSYALQHNLKSLGASGRRSHASIHTVQLASNTKLNRRLSVKPVFQHK